MGMNIFVQAFAAPDAEFKKMKRRFTKAEDDGIEIPEDVEAYFDGDEPGPGRRIGVREIVQDWEGGGCWGKEIDVSKIPPGVKTIRFVVSP